MELPPDRLEACPTNIKFLVTGGTGFIGWRVVQNLLRRSIPVIVGELNADPAVLAKLPGAEVATLDVSDPKSVEAVFQKHPGIAHVIHLAYLMSAEVEANPHLGASVNLLGMINLFEATVRHRRDQESALQSCPQLEDRPRVCAQARQREADRHRAACVDAVQRERTT